MPKVKVVKCSDETLWYYDQLGKVFDVWQGQWNDVWEACYAVDYEYMMLLNPDFVPYFRLSILKEDTILCP